jgi:hypothetical protein
VGLKKNALMDNMKLSYLEIQKRLNAVEERAKEVGNKKSVLSKLLQATKIRLNKIKGYITQ